MAKKRKPYRHKGPKQPIATWDQYEALSRQHEAAAYAVEDELDAAEVADLVELLQRGRADG